MQDFWNDNGCDSVMLQACLPANAVDFIVSIPIRMGMLIYIYILIWTQTSNGVFTVNSAYQLHSVVSDRPD